MRGSSLDSSSISRGISLGSGKHFSHDSSFVYVTILDLDSCGRRKANFRIYEAGFDNAMFDQHRKWTISTKPARVFLDINNASIVYAICSSLLMAPKSHPTMSRACSPILWLSSCFSHRNFLVADSSLICGSIKGWCHCLWFSAAKRVAKFLCGRLNSHAVGHAICCPLFPPSIPAPLDVYLVSPLGCLT